MINLRRLICPNSLTTRKILSNFVIEETSLALVNGVKLTSNNGIECYQNLSSRAFSDKSSGSGDGDNDKGDWIKPGGTGSGSTSWNVGSSWSSGVTKEHFDGVDNGQHASSVGSQDSGSSRSVGSGNSSMGNSAQSSATGSKGYQGSTSASSFSSLPIDYKLEELKNNNNMGKTYTTEWSKRMLETSELLKQVREPGARGSYLKDSEKAEMYRLHKEDPEVYTVERLAKDYRIMRQRVHAILWLKENEEEQEKKLGKPLDDSIEVLLDKFPEFFNYHDREFHVASLPYRPHFKVMPEGWDGIIKDKDEVLYEVSMKEDGFLYYDFVLRMKFGKKMMAGEVYCHKYSRRRSEEGWKITVEKLGRKGKRGVGGGWKFVSLPNGSSRPLNDLEKLYLKRETPRQRRRFLAPNAVHSSIVN